MSKLTDTTIRRLHTISKNVNIMMGYRNYEPNSDFDPEDLNFEKFKRFVDNDVSNLNIEFIREDDDSKAHVLYAHEMSQVTKSTLDKFIRKSDRYTEAILVAHLVPAKTTQIDLPNVKWQLFSHSELLHNPITHVDTPEHTLLTDGEMKDLIRDTGTASYGIINTSDPVAKWNGWVEGGMVRINRNESDVISGKQLNYRLIIKD